MPATTEVELMRVVGGGFFAMTALSTLGEVRKLDSMGPVRPA